MNKDNLEDVKIRLTRENLLFLKDRSPTLTRVINKLIDELKLSKELQKKIFS